MGSNENSFLDIKIVITLSKHLFSGYEEVPHKQKEATSQDMLFHSRLIQVVYF